MSSAPCAIDRPTAIVAGQVENAGLSEALRQGKTTFAPEEWQAFGVSRLYTTSYANAHPEPPRGVLADMANDLRYVWSVIRRRPIPSTARYFQPVSRAPAEAIVATARTKVRVQHALQVSQCWPKARSESLLPTALCTCARVPALSPQPPPPRSRAAAPDRAGRQGGLEHDAAHARAL